MVFSPRNGKAQIGHASPNTLLFQMRRFNGIPAPTVGNVKKQTQFRIVIADQINPAE